MVEVAPNNQRAHPNRCSDRKAHSRGKPNNYKSEDGSGGMAMVVGTWGGENQPTQADTRLEGSITGKGQTHRFRW